MDVDTMRMYWMLKRRVCYMCKPVHKNTQNTPDQYAIGGSVRAGMRKRRERRGLIRANFHADCLASLAYRSSSFWSVWEDTRGTSTCLPFQGAREYKNM